MNDPPGNWYDWTGWSLVWVVTISVTAVPSPSWSGTCDVTVIGTEPARWFVEIRAMIGFVSMMPPSKLNGSLPETELSALTWIAIGPLSTSVWRNSLFMYKVSVAPRISFVVASSTMVPGPNTASSVQVGSGWSAYTVISPSEGAASMSRS